MEYPGVRLGQRGGLFDLYQYYLGGYDQATGDEGPVTTDPFPGAGGGGDSGGPGIDPFAERTARTYLPRDERGFQIQPGTGSGVFTRQYQPDNFGVDRNIATFGDAGKPILSGFTEEEEDPGRIATFFDKLKSGISSINLGNFPTISPAMIMSRLGRPADAIYSYGGDTMGIGSRAGLTQDEVKNLEYIESFGGVDEYGRDIYGKNVVSNFGDYEQGVKDDIARIEQTLLDAQKKYGGLTDEYYNQTKLIRQKLTDYQGFIDKVEADDTKEEEQIKTKNLMTEFYDIKEKEADTTGDGIITTITAPVTQSDTGDASVAEKIAAENRAAAVASSSRGIQSAGNRAQSGGDGGRDRDRGAAAAGMGGGSRQATSAGSTKSSRSDGGWGWKDGGLVRKPYSDGGIVDLL